MYEPHRHTFAMGCLFLALVLIGMYWIATPSRSQEAPLPLCGKAGEYEALIGKQYGEGIIAGGVSGGKPVIIMMNPDTHTFSIIIRRTNEMSCLAIGGNGFAIAYPVQTKGPGL